MRRDVGGSGEIQMPSWSQIMQRATAPARAVQEDLGFSQSVQADPERHHSQQKDSQQVFAWMSRVFQKKHGVVFCWCFFLLKVPWDSSPSNNHHLGPNIFETKNRSIPLRIPSHLPKNRRIDGPKIPSPRHRSFRGKSRILRTYKRILRVQ